MSIRIGSSCALSVPMAIGKVVETRRFIGSHSDWIAVSQYCIQNKIYLIVTICINRNDMSGHYPGDTEWKAFIDSTCQKLKNYGGNRYNCRISLINEPMKFCSREQYAHLINLAYPIVKGYGFLCGAGNEEFLTAQAKGNMYQYILSHCNFDILDVHIQGSCDSKEKTEFWCNTARNWTNKSIDCTEAFYSDIAIPSGWQLLNTQLNCAENILKCKNFCNVFNNLDTTMFPFNTSSWHKLCFKINGVLRSNYWAHWKILMDSKAPIPNIKEVFEMYGIEINYVKPNSKNEETRAIQQIMIDKGYNLSPYGADGIYGSVTKAAIEKWQTDNNLKIDGWVGKETWQWIFENIETGLLRFMQMIVRTGRYK